MSEARRQKLVLFCGAGASTGAGIPTMASFGDALRDSRFLNPDEQADFDAVQSRCHHLSATLGVSARNLENLASFLGILEMTQPNLEFDDCKTLRTPSEALRLIIRCIRHVVRPRLTTNTADSSFGNMMQWLATNADLSIVTTNYDINIELALTADSNGASRCRTSLSKELMLKCCANNPGGHSLYSTQSGAVPLYKLHGSLNWYKSDNRVIVDDRISSLNLDGRFAGFGLAAEHGATPRHNRNDVLIIPPVANKMQMEPELLSQWRGASQAIAIADQIWFVGYSFPNSDNFMQYFIASSLHTNSSIRRIVVVDPSDAVVFERSPRIFSAPRFREILLPLPIYLRELRCPDIFCGNLEQAIGEPLLKRRLERQSRARFMEGGDVE